MFPKTTSTVFHTFYMVVIWLCAATAWSSSSTEPVAGKSGAVTDGFESGTFSTLGWETKGDNPWFIAADRTVDGVLSARCNVNQSGQAGELALELDFAKDGSFSFWITTDSDIVANRLTFYIDGQKQAQWSGRVDWTLYAKHMTKGRHRFTWVYRHDDNEASGLAAAWIDEVSFPWFEGVDSFRLSPAAGAFFPHQTDGAPWLRSR